MLDLIVAGGTVVSPAGSIQADIGIADGRITTICAPSGMTHDAAERLDADGMYVVPGGIDAHVHFNLGVTEACVPSRRLTDHELRRSEVQQPSSTSGSRLETAARSPPPRAKIAELGAQKPHIDYALHLMLTGAVTFEAMDELREVITGGVPSFKMFTTFAGNSASGDLYSDDGRIWGVMERLTAHGGLAMVHAEDDCIIDYNVRRLYDAGQEDGRNIHLARPPLAEEAAIRRMILLAERSDCPLYIVHVSSASGVAAIREARQRRVSVFGEVLHNYLTFTSENYAGEEGTLYHNYPPLKSARDRDSLWSAITSGDSHSGLGRLHDPEDFEALRQSRRQRPGRPQRCGDPAGCAVLRGGDKGRLSLEQFVRLSSEAPARLFGLFHARARLRWAVTPTSPSSTPPPDTRSGSPSCTQTATTASGTGGSWTARCTPQCSADQSSPRTASGWDQSMRALRPRWFDNR